MAAPIAVQSAEQALALDYLAQRRQYRDTRLFFHQLRVVDLAAGIVEDHHQVIPALVLKPAMAAPLDVQQHPWQGSAWPALAMPPALAPPLHQPCPLQRCLHPRVTQFDLVLLA